jgi:transposase
VRLARERWFERFAGVRVDQLVFLDEFGATTTMQRTRGRAPPGERVVSKVPHGHWKVISTIAAMTVRGIEASASFDGDAADTELFVTFVREGLVPMLVPAGQVVVMDNLPAHKSPQVDRLIASAGARLLLRLPPYSPDFNPIEQAISKVNRCCGSWRVDRWTACSTGSPKRSARSARPTPCTTSPTEATR